MRRTTCLTLVEVLFVAFFVAQLDAAPIPDVVRIRQGQGDTTQMVQTITKIHNEAGQTLTETCYYVPDDPDNQSCSTAVTWTTDGDKDQDGGTTTIWPDENGSATTQILNEANPTSVVFPSVLFPSQATGTRDTDIETASAIGSISASATSTISETQHSSELLVAESTAEIAVPTNTAGKSSDSHSVDVATMGEELDSPFPGQHLGVLPIGLGIYCSVMGTGLLVVLYMFLVRVKYRRDYRRRKTRLGLGMGVAMNVGMGFDKRFASSEVRSA